MIEIRPMIAVATNLLLQIKRPIGPSSPLHSLIGFTHHQAPQFIPAFCHPPPNAPPSPSYFEASSYFLPTFVDDPLGQHKRRPQSFNSIPAFSLSSTSVNVKCGFWARQSSSVAATANFRWPLLGRIAPSPPAVCFPLTLTLPSNFGPPDEALICLPARRINFFIGRFDEEIVSLSCGHYTWEIWRIKWKERGAQIGGIAVRKMERKKTRVPSDNSITIFLSPPLAPKFSPPFWLLFPTLIPRPPPFQFCSLFFPTRRNLWPQSNYKRH